MRPKTSVIVTSILPFFVLNPFFPNVMQTFYIKTLLCVFSIVRGKKHSWYNLANLFNNGLIMLIKVTLDIYYNH